MKDRWLVGVDIGTTGSKGVLVDLEGKVKAYQFREHAVSTPRAGWCEQDADGIWWADLRAILRALIAQSGVEPRAIVGVGISALCPDMLPVDEAGRPLRPGILYSDTRAAAETDAITAQLGADRIGQLAGGPLPPDSIGPKIIWFRNHEPQAFERMRTVHTASSYLVFRLTGQCVVDATTAGGYSPLYDAGRMGWRDDVCGALGLRADMLPQPRFATEIAGEVTEAAAQETGLAAGTPVIVGCCDGEAEMISTGAVEAGEASLLYGTTMGIGIIVPPPEPASTLSVMGLGVPGLYVAGTVMSTSGALTRWFRDTFGQMEKEAESALGINAYQLLSAAAETIPPGAEGLLVLPYFAGERAPIWDSRARGLVLGLTLSHTRRHIYRALLESTAFGLRHGLEPVLEAGVRVARIVSTGGGIRARVWPQIVSDVIGYDQHLVKIPYGSPYGGAYLAGMGVGVFPGLTTLRDVWVQDTVAVTANPERKRIYDRYFEVYRGLYDKLKDDMHALADLAAGVYA